MITITRNDSEREDRTIREVTICLNGKKMARHLFSAQWNPCDFDVIPGKRGYDYGLEYTVGDTKVIIMSYCADLALAQTVRRFLAKDASYKDLREVVKGGA